MANDDGLVGIKSFPPLNFPYFFNLSFSDQEMEWVSEGLLRDSNLCNLTKFHILGHTEARYFIRLLNAIHCIRDCPKHFGRWVKGRL